MSDSEAGVKAQRFSARDNSVIFVDNLTCADYSATAYDHRSVSFRKMRRGIAIVDYCNGIVRSNVTPSLR